MSEANNYTATILVCGGSKLSVKDASNICFSISPDVPNAKWQRALDMPRGRLMPNAVILPGTFEFLFLL